MAPSLALIVKSVPLPTLKEKKRMTLAMEHSLHQYKWSWGWHETLKQEYMEIWWPLTDKFIIQTQFWIFFPTVCGSGSGVFAVAWWTDCAEVHAEILTADVDFLLHQVICLLFIYMACNVIPCYAAVGSHIYFADLYPFQKLTSIMHEVWLLPARW